MPNAQAAQGGPGGAGGYGWLRVATSLRVQLPCSRRKINKQAKASLAKKIEKSTLKSNAQNRLISELSKMLILTNSMGWKLQYERNVISKESDFSTKIKS